jgi:hypothetical protein
MNDNFELIDAGTKLYDGPPSFEADWLGEGNS